MVDTSTPRVPLGATTLNRKWQCDIKEADEWVGLFGLTDFQFSPGKQNMVDDGDFDSEGWTSSAATARGWGAKGKYRNATIESDQTAYDPGQLLVFEAGIAATDADNVLRVRIYEMAPNGPRYHAYEGNVNVTYDDDGGDLKAKSMSSFEFIGKGKLTRIAHPAGAGA
jgi:hypothetical protein